MKIMLVFGTRPEAIKMCPLVNALKQAHIFDVSVCVTAQHREMLDQVLNVFEITPDYDLDIMAPQQTLFDITVQVLSKMKSVLAQEKPDLVLVHGDTTTSFAAALSAYYLEIPVGHVEAGLRTYDHKAPFPEEFNRQSVDSLSDYYFAPSIDAKDNLIREGKPGKNIFVTGNTGIDALRTTVSNDYRSDLLTWVGNARLLLVTAHRRENLGRPMQNIFFAIRQIARNYPDVKIIYPLHLNPEIKKLALQELGCSNGIKLVDPLNVIEFHNLIARSCLILTDSGGIQEEAPSLGKPVLVMRETTERPEGVRAGTLKLVGTETRSIYQEAARLLDEPSAYDAMAQASNPYGDGTACLRIMEAINGLFGLEPSQGKTGSLCTSSVKSGRSECI